MTGLYKKYAVRRYKDKHNKHLGCEYFVLDWDHDPFTIPAMKAYAAACELEFPELANDLLEKISLYSQRHKKTMSYVELGEKLHTLIEEHVKYKNMIATCHNALGDCTDGNDVRTLPEKCVEASLRESRLLKENAELKKELEKLNRIKNNKNLDLELDEKE